MPHYSCSMNYWWRRLQRHLVRDEQCKRTVVNPLLNKVSTLVGLIYKYIFDEVIRLRVTRLFTTFSYLFSSLIFIWKVNHYLNSKIYFQPLCYTQCLFKFKLNSNALVCRLKHEKNEKLSRKRAILVLSEYFTERTIETQAVDSV